MRKLLMVVVAVAAFFLPAAATAAATANFNNGQPHSCVPGSTGPQNQSLTCTGTVSGLGNTNELAYVVLVVHAGCSNNGNTDIPGQRRFITGPLVPDRNGSAPYSVTGTINCNGNQVAFITSPATLQLWLCTTGSPTFDKNGNQTNSSCTLTDTRTERF